MCDLVSLGIVASPHFRVAVRTLAMTCITLACEVSACCSPTLPCSSVASTSMCPLQLTLKASTSELLSVDMQPCAPHIKALLMPSQAALRTAGKDCLWFVEKLCGQMFIRKHGTVFQPSLQS